MATGALQTPSYREARRELAGLTARGERRALLWLVERVPGWVTPDHLTALGLLAMILGGLAYAQSRNTPWLLLVVNVALALNWFGDSLDGSLARHRGWLRPRYGFYMDHIVDAFGALFLLAGLLASGQMSGSVVAALLVAYYLFSINMYLQTHTLGCFKMSYGPFGGTELRILLAILNVVCWLWPRIGLAGHSIRVFDVVGICATLGLVLTLLLSIASGRRKLATLEPERTVVSH